jgi:hypothetical protein
MRPWTVETSDPPPVGGRAVIVQVLGASPSVTPVTHPAEAYFS